MFSVKQGHCWYHFYNVLGMTRSLTRGLNPGPATLKTYHNSSQKNICKKWNWKKTITQNLYQKLDDFIFLSESTFKQLWTWVPYPVMLWEGNITNMMKVTLLQQYYNCSVETIILTIEYTFYMQSITGNVTVWEKYVIKFVPK